MGKKWETEGKEKKKGGRKFKERERGKKEKSWKVEEEKENVRREDIINCDIKQRLTNKGINIRETRIKSLSQKS